MIKTMGEFREKYSRGMINDWPCLKIISEML